MNWLVLEVKKIVSYCGRIGTFELVLSRYYGLNTQQRPRWVYNITEPSEGVDDIIRVNSNRSNHNQTSTVRFHFVTATTVRSLSSE